MTAPQRHEGLTAPAEDCLKAVYELERAGAGAAVTTNDLAHRLALAAASVTGMVKRLAGQGLIDHARYRGVRLTEQGRRTALRTLRRHRVIETYLVSVLGFGWDRVHEEAERLEHAASDELVDRMAAALGNPAFDPHGAPIPTRDGGIAEGPAGCALSEVAPGERGRIARVEDEDAGRLRYLASLGIRPGVEFEVVDRAPFGGPLTLRIAGAPRQLGPQLAAHVVVVPGAG
ncbi:MAG TPA: metal-dependent transcriptional regulator [Gemmatimonadaceae bacterium]|nr:metal-dependent transcriptional regulator [Gemmatimonadaceae bacterium]